MKIRDLKALLAPLHDDAEIYRLNDEFGEGAEIHRVVRGYWPIEPNFGGPCSDDKTDATSMCDIVILK